MMNVLAETPKSTVLEASPRYSSDSTARPVCSICADTMIAAEASVFHGDEEISHLWTCDTCGYGMVTRHLRDPK